MGEGSCGHDVYILFNHICELKTYINHCHARGQMKAYSAMPYETQVECIQWFGEKYGITIPTITVEAGATHREWVPEGCQRFLLLYERKHVMCCRFDETSDGRRCVIMDTEQFMYPNESTKRLEVIAACENLPEYIRSATLDSHCHQQRMLSGGCTVMSLGNLAASGTNSVTAAQAERIRKDFIVHSKRKSLGALKKNAWTAGTLAS
jgi:hypothetical protein